MSTIWWRQQWETAWHALGESVDLGEGIRMSAAVAKHTLLCSYVGCSSQIQPGNLYIAYGPGPSIYCQAHAPGEFELREEG